jgi:hypothetical protein
MHSKYLRDCGFGINLRRSNQSTKIINLIHHDLLAFILKPLVTHRSCSIKAVLHAGNTWRKKGKANNAANTLLKGEFIFLLIVFIFREVH